MLSSSPKFNFSDGGCGSFLKKKDPWEPWGSCSLHLLVWCKGQTVVVMRTCFKDH